MILDLDIGGIFLPGLLVLAVVALVGPVAVVRLFAAAGLSLRQIAVLAFIQCDSVPGRLRPPIGCSFCSNGSLSQLHGISLRSSQLGSPPCRSFGSGRSCGFTMPFFSASMYRYWQNR